jgi:putative membrane protein
MVASKLFSGEDRKAISAAVTEAEKKTSAEIVPVVASTSDRYERAEDLVGLAMSFIAVAASWTQFQRLHPSSDWEGADELTLHLPYVLSIMAGGWIVGVILAKGIPWLKRLAVSRRAMTARVLIAAHHAFDSLHADRTSGGTGVVLFVSLFERRVCVWADRKISERIPEAEWKGITEQLIQALRAGKPRDGFVEAIRKAGELLSKPFPIQPGDVNELSNELRILD